MTRPSSKSKQMPAPDTQLAGLTAALAQKDRALQIEAALEKVRVRTTAMQKSEELNDVTLLFFQQFAALGETPKQISICLFDEEVKSGQLFFTFDGTRIDQSVEMELEKDRFVMSHARKAFLAGQKKVEITLSGKILQQYNHWRNELLGISKWDESTAILKKSWYICGVVYSRGMLAFSSEQPVSDETRNLIERFASVFDMIFTRFLDLQKAEAQAREARVEAGLERVRARAMAMHSSDELNELIGMVFQELTKLDLVLTRCTILIFDRQTDDSRWWMANAEAPGEPNNYFVPYHKMVPYLQLISYWKKNNLHWTYILEGAIKKEWDQFLVNQTGLKELPVAAMEGLMAPDRVLLHGSANNFGCITAASLEPLTPGQVDILLRFAKVFDLTYTRFNDLKQAEAQAREAQIEAALEKARSHAMAMRSSEDLAETINNFYQQLRSLGLTPRRCGVGVLSKESRVSELTSMYTTEEGKAVQVLGKLNLSNHPMLEGIYEHWLEQKEYRPVLRGDEIKAYYQFISPQISYPDIPQDAAQYGYFFFFPEGGVYAWSENEICEDDLRIYRRFTSVLSLTHKRYKDLKLAEAQAREAQIESSLERVRGRAMAMQQADDVLTICALLFTELRKQGFSNLRNTMINIHDDEKSSFLNYDYSENAGKNITSYYYNHHPVIEKLVRQTRSATDAFSEITLSGKELSDWRAFRMKSGEKDDDRLESLEQLYYYFYSIGTGAVGISVFHPLIGDQLEVLKRFRNVFELAYRRYIDITRAATQAREAQIEAALERVRAKAMAMHSSQDVAIAASMVFTELRKLGITPIRCGVGLIKHDPPSADLYAATSINSNDSLALAGQISMQSHPVFQRIYEAWESKSDYFAELDATEIRAYYDQLPSGFSAPNTAGTDQKQYGHFISVSVGCLYAWSDKRYEEAEIKVLTRFAGIIDLTFRRYMELQQSESNARDAIRDASLDRIRAQIASMRTTSDLERIIPLIWHELNVLNVPFIRCGVFIMDDQQRQIHTFLSTPDGKAIASFHLSYDSRNMREALHNWREGKLYITRWGKNDFLDIATTLVEQGAISSQEQYLNTLPMDGMHLHFMPFLQGMLYVGNAAHLEKDEIDLLQSVADAFSTAYARYEDFNKLEAAKRQVDRTLAELKQAQQQLVQSEKMASLGELTAGIAHEIQNPLNFVNNFSEVSAELLEEMKAELNKGDIDEAKLIANDVQENLQKILHHGKRADGIVKGMLQHSRSGTGQKEPVNLNKLADEYVRLAYHGLRAKDKSFNAKFETQFDETLPDVNIVAQDMGRVILNLITNAFYSVSQKKKQANQSGNNSYEPTVTVRTAKILLPSGKQGVNVTVHDNGTGIPPRIVEKIFQPFFTTKPTGQGTGLGLSMSYDIVVKAHEGQLTVDSKEGEFAEFNIQLPI